MKKAIVIIINIILILAMVACSENDGRATDCHTENTLASTPTEEVFEPTTVINPLPTRPKDDLDETEDTIPENTEELITDDYIQLTNLNNEIFNPFEGKIERLLGNVRDLTFYSKDGIYHPVDNNGQKVMHKFDIGEVDQIIFYYNETINLYGHITSEICIYTKPNDSQTYLSITDESQNSSYSRALTMQIDCLADNVIFAERNVDEVMVVCKANENVECLHYNVKTNELIGRSVIKGMKGPDMVDLKTVYSNGYRMYAIDSNNRCYLVETYFGDLIDMDNGEYIVHLYEQYYFDNAQKLVTYEYDSLFLMTNDIDHIHSWRFISGGDIKNVKVKLPHGLTINNIEKTWGTDKCLIVLFDNGQYYLVEEITSLETKQFVEMKYLKFDIDAYQIVGFACEGFDLVTLLSDGKIYICEDVL